MKTWINEQLAEGTLDFAKLERMLFHGMMIVFQQILEDLLGGIYRARGMGSAAIDGEDMRLL